MAGALWDGGISGHSLGELGTQCVCVYWFTLSWRRVSVRLTGTRFCPKFPYALFGLVIRRFLSGGGGRAGRDRQARQVPDSDRPSPIGGNGIRRHTLLYLKNNLTMHQANSVHARQTRTDPPSS
jgi:hypothetical protein